MRNTTQMQHWRKVLRGLRDRLDANSAQVRADVTRATDDESDDRNVDSSAHIESIGLAENEATLQREVEDALGRVNAGSFGVCERCAKHIPRSRLKTVPYARYCIRCARREEQSKNN